jgi:hypothetical protein
MKTLGIYLLVLMAGVLLYCQCGDKLLSLGKELPAAVAGDTHPVTCNDDEAIALLEKKVSEADDGVYEAARDFIVTWERKSDDRVVCRAKCIYKAPRKKPKNDDDPSSTILSAVNEVFGLDRKPGDAVWVSYVVYRTMRYGQKGGYLFVDLIDSGKTVR